MATAGDRRLRAPVADPRRGDEAAATVRTPPAGTGATRAGRKAARRAGAGPQRPPRRRSEGAHGPGGRPVAAGERRGLRYRVLPRSLLGITAMILAFALGAGFSGVVLYSYYQYRLDQTDGRVNALINGYKKQFANAEGDLQASANNAKAQIQTQLAPLQQLGADTKTLARLVKDLSPSLFFVHTQDVNGQPVVGSAFVISSNNDQSLLITSASAVAASQQSPGPVVFARQANNDIKVSVRTVDAANDLALIVLPRGKLPVIKVAPTSPAPQLGDKVFAVSALGSAGASVSEGAITDVSASGIAENAAIGVAYQGGPLVNASGQVVAIASRTYAPQGFGSDGVFNAPFPQAACTKVLTCPGGTIGSSQ